MTDQVATIEALRRDVRRLKAGLAIAAVAGGTFLLAGAASSPGDARFGTVTAERINIVEPDGLYRAVLTSAARTPGPMKQARDGAKEGKRNFPFAGLIIYDADGEEQGGYGTGQSEKQGSLAVRAIDWGDGRGEAVATFRRVAPDGSGLAGTYISEYPPQGETPMDGRDRRRIKLQVPGRDAEVLLADREGRDRIVLRVDEAGEAVIEIRDAEGRVTFRAPRHDAAEAPPEQG